jgi:2-methylcitrate dehydratase PrpD
VSEPTPSWPGWWAGRVADSLLAAQRSLPYAVAARTVFGSAGLSAYSAARRRDPVLRAMLDRVFLDIDETALASDSSTVKIALADGTQIDAAPSRVAREPARRQRPLCEVRRIGQAGA